MGDQHAQPMAGKMGRLEPLLIMYITIKNPHKPTHLAYTYMQLSSHSQLVIIRTIHCIVSTHHRSHHYS